MNFLLLSVAQASLRSPFPSTVEGITIQNTHEVSPGIYRGQAPLGKIRELLKLGVTDILIFKNQTKNEIDRELEEIRELEKQNDLIMRTTQVDFLWHDYKSYKMACEKTIDALKIMNSVSQSPKKKLFYHCTVGEDRTGFLSGIWKMLTSKKSKKQAFYYEMCENGYGRGNPHKPNYVVNEIREDLTPLFSYMANLISSGKISLKKLTKKYCRDDIGKWPELNCRVSGRFEAQ